MKTLMAFDQEITMRKVGNKDGHCYGMCAVMADHIMNEWKSIERDQYLGRFMAEYIEAQHGRLTQWATTCEAVQRVADIGRERAMSLQAALVEGGLGQNFGGVQVMSDAVSPMLTQLLHELVLEERYRAVCYPVNDMRDHVFLYLIDFQLPTIKGNQMVNAGHVILLGMELGGSGEWQEIVIFDPNYGVMECEFTDRGTLDGWWMNYAKSYRGMGHMQVVNVFHKEMYMRSR